MTTTNLFFPLLNPEVLQMNGTKSTVAVFDFDGTLTFQDSFLPFIRWNHDWKSYWLGLAKHHPIILSYLMGRCSNKVIKERLLTYFYQGWKIEDFQLSARKYSQQFLPNLLLGEAIDRLKWHQSQGHRVILLSAALHIYLYPWAQEMNIDHVLATHLDVQRGRITGKLKGENCYGEEKVKQLKKLLGTLENYYLYAYGDSKGDFEMLKVSDEPYYRHFGRRQLFIVR
jgi:HAD superfamily hydrolase (TIGR01490 family)